MSARFNSAVGSSWRSIVGLVWLIGFLFWFHLQPLPNNSPFTDAAGVQRDLMRSDIWAAIIDDPGMLNPFRYLSASGDRDNSGWSYLSDRVPFMCGAGFIIAGAWLSGIVVCRQLLNEIALLRSERIVLSLGLGLSCQSLWVLICGLFGHLSTPTLFAPAAVSLLGIAASCVIRAARKKPAAAGCKPPVVPVESDGIRPEVLSAVSNDGRVSVGLPERSAAKDSRLMTAVVLCGLAVFSLHILLGGMTPPFDFDVREYHLQGPKEWFLQSRIVPLRHNVYTSFPFLSEMLSLQGMVVQNDWWSGAVTGKLVLTTFQFLTAVTVYAIGSRWFGGLSGLIAALVSLSTPWCVRISLIAYAEGALTFFLAASVMTALLADAQRSIRSARRLVFVTGLMAGSAMAAKYPGVLSVVVPVGGWILWRSLRQRKCRGDADEAIAGHQDLTVRGPAFVYPAVLFAIGVLAAVSLWLIRNAVWHGNPVYPLVDSVFHSPDWNADLNARWKKAHGPDDHDIWRIPAHIRDVVVGSDWQSGLIFGLAVPALLLVRRSAAVRWLWLMTIWIVSTWWLLTHRIDRFWIPVLPVTAALSGAAWTLNRSRVFQWLVLSAVVVQCAFNYGLCRTSVVGFHAGLMEMSAAKRLPIRSDIRYLNSTLPQAARVLMVGEAEVFDAEFDVVYNTVFDDNIFEEWTADTSGSAKETDKPLKPPEVILSQLHRHGITHVYVNWSEILRYRLTYGYTRYVQPRRFQALVESGVLDAPVALEYGSVRGLNEQQQNEIRRWESTDSLFTDDGRWARILIYRVPESVRPTESRR
ncbi:MAG: hypothetical protein KDA89_03560 [Planctomycetaceae bacterium]|nr:hypothetical protein [Planctomycetaceae bacterium]